MSEIQTSTWNETASSNDVATPNGLPISPVPIRAEITDWGRETMAVLKRDWDRSHTTLSSSGSSNAYVLTYGAAPPAYANGLRFSFKASFSNSGSATCNVNSLGAKTIKKNGASGLATLASGDIQTDNHVELEYDADADVLVLLNPLGPPPVAGTGIGVSGSTVSMAPTGLSAVTPASDDYVVIADTSDSGNPKKALVSALPSAVTTSGMLRQLTKFTSSGTYSKPSWLKFVIVELVGGGGGGGSALATSSYQNEGGGGGGGGYSLKKIAAASLGANETVTIGAGGAGGNPGYGSAGGTTSFGSHCSATGGAGGTTPADTNKGSSAGLGGSGSGGDINLSGDAGMGGIAQLNANILSNYNPCTSYGGNSRLGPGKRYGGSGGDSFGPRGAGLSADANTGGGGSGGYEAFSNTAYAGGSGGSGIVLVWEYE